MPDKDIETSLKQGIGWKLPTIVFLLVLLLWIGTWVLSVGMKDRGTFGDMFGSINALFSGLAFTGVIIAILLQREELILQRKEIEKNRIEFKKAVDAQELNSKLSALSALLGEYKAQLSVNEQVIQREAARGIPMNLFFQEENLDLNRRKKIIIKEIESILEKSGIVLINT